MKMQFMEKIHTEIARLEEIPQALYLLHGIAMRGDDGCFMPPPQEKLMHTSHRTVLISCDQIPQSHSYGGQGLALLGGVSDPLLGGGGLNLP